jgi:hypothetical protein
MGSYVKVYIACPVLAILYQSPVILYRCAGFFSAGVTPEAAGSAAYAAARRASCAALSARSFASASSFAFANAASVGFTYPDPSRLRSGHDILCSVNYE